MSSPRLEEFLNSNRVPYDTMKHPHTFTAQETAMRAHIDGHAMAKTVMVKLDGKLAMAVLPSDEWLDVTRLRQVSGAREVGLADEADFKDRFPECEVGAMPPFGNLYRMDVYASESFAGGDRIAFNAGNHREVVQMGWDDFERLVHPRVVQLSRH